MNPKPSQTAASPKPAAHNSSRLPSWWLPGLFTVLFCWLTIIGWLRIERDVMEDAEAKASTELQLHPATAGALASAFQRDPELLSDADLRAAALAHEARRKAASPTDVVRPLPPGAEAAWQRWQGQQQALEQLVAEIKSFPEGSVQWHLREELRQRQEDAPEAP